jgi:hypothetical protein
MPEFDNKLFALSAISHQLSAISFFGFPELFRHFYG